MDLMDLMDLVRRPVVHNVKLSAVGGREVMVGSLCVSAYYLLYSTKRHDGDDEITVKISPSSMNEESAVCCADAKHGDRGGGA